MNTKRYPDIDYEFRPSYWDDTDPLTAILKNIKGKNRRQMVRDFWNEGRFEELYETFLKDSLSDEERIRLGQIHPSFMGGEYLPDYLPGEVEIARIELESTTHDVISIRAVREGKAITYRIVDEYPEEFSYLFSPEESQVPFSLGELVDFLDGANIKGHPCELGLALCHNVVNYECGGDLDDLRDFTSVESDFYPDLSKHYDRVIKEWYENEKRLLEEWQNS